MPLELQEKMVIEEKVIMCVGNTYLGHKSLHKYTRVASGQDGVEVKNLIDLVLLKKDVLVCVQDVRAMRRMGGGLLDHHVVLLKWG